MHRIRSLPLALTSLSALVACGPSADPDRPSTQLPAAVAHLEDSELPAAVAALEPVIASDEASAAEYAMGAVLHLLNAQRSCSGVSSAMAQLRVDLDPAVVFFGSEGYFARLRQDAPEAERFIETQLELAVENSVFTESPSVETVLQATYDALPCLDEAERRLGRAFELMGGPDVQIELPGGLFHVSEAMVMNGPELRLLQAGLGLTATSLRISRAFDLSLPTGDAVHRWTEDAEEHAANVEALEALADQLNQRAFGLKPEGQEALGEARDALERHLGTLTSALVWAQQTPDGVGQLQLGRVSPRALEILEGYALALQSALEGPTRVPLEGAEVELDLSLFFEARFAPMAAPMVVETNEYPGDPEFEVPGYYSASVTVDPTALADFVNQFFSKRVVPSPGPLGRPSEVNLSGMTQADEDALETLPRVIDPLRSYLSRNFGLE